MRLASFSAALLAPALFSAAEEEQKPEISPSVSPALDLLPEGSTLTDVSLPRYDEEKKPAALLRAGLMTVVSKGHITGENVQLHVFESDGTTKLTAHFGSASYLVDSGLLDAREVVNLTGENYRTRGIGAIFQLNERSGFILGPVETTFTRKAKENAPDKKTAMNSATPTLTGLALLGFTSIALAAPPQTLTATELALFDERARDSAPEYATKSAPTKRDIIAADQRSQAADLAFRTFANAVNRPGLLTIATAKPIQNPADPAAPAQPGESTRITCDGGMYFDVDKNHVVYLENVVVKDTDFTLSAGKELKVFLQKKPEQKEGEKAPEGLGTFSDVDTIVGTGGVKVVRKDAKGQAMTATADTATYDAKTGDIVLRGGFPRVQNGPNSLQAKEPGLYIRIYANGNVLTQPGKWQTDLVKPN